jgi:hypothetical protein
MILATTYLWALYRAEHCVPKPDRYAYRPYYDFDLDLTRQPVFLEGCWARCYGQAGNAREN